MQPAIVSVGGHQVVQAFAHAFAQLGVVELARQMIDGEPEIRILLRDVADHMQILRQSEHHDRHAGLSRLRP